MGINRSEMSKEANLKGIQKKFSGLSGLGISIRQFIRNS